MERNKIQRLTQFFFLLTAVEAALALVWLRLIASDGKRAVLLGFSASRLAMAAVLLGFLLAACAGFLRSGNGHKDGGFPLAAPFPALFLAAAAFAAAALLYTGFITPETNHAYYTRLLPLGLFFILLGGQTLLFSRLINATGPIDSENDKKMLRTALLLSAVGVAFFALVKFSRIGVTPDPFDWQPNGMSIQYWQLAAALLSALVLFTLSFALRHKVSEPVRTGILFVLIWAVAALIWTAVPTLEALKHSYFMEITPPNNLPYPASDAAYFGLWSESIQAGLGFKNAVISRQLFVVILAFLQTLAGRDLLLAIDFLTILLALIPACLFLLGSRIHSQGAGLLAAGIAILRELNTLAIGPLFGVSNSKMFLSDLPALLFFLFFLLAAQRWFRDPQSRTKALLAGGFLSLAGLIRSQFLILLIPILVLHGFRKMPVKKRLIGALLFVIGTAAVLTPALVRGFVLTGGPTLEDSSIHGFEIARRYSADPDFTPERIPGESSADFQSRMSQGILDFTLAEPGYVFHFIANHFSKDLIDSWLVLPDGLPADLTLRDITDPAYQNVESRFLYGALLPKLIFAFLAALGIAAAFRRAGIGGLLPLILCPIYMLSAALGRYSGWRFILPADWFCYFYAAAGFFELLFLISASVANPTAGSERTEPSSSLHSLPPQQTSRPIRARAAALAFLLLILIGSLPVTVNFIFPPQVAPDSDADNLKRMQTWAEQYGEPYRSFLAEVEGGGLDLHSGRAIYPRYFEAGQGLTSANPWPVYATRDFNRLGFVLLNEENTNVILPIAQTPEPFPNGSDCLVIGFDHADGYFKAAAVILLDGENQPAVILP